MSDNELRDKIEACRAELLASRDDADEDAGAAAALDAIDRQCRLVDQTAAAIQETLSGDVAAAAPRLLARADDVLGASRRLSERAASTVMERADLLEGSEISPLLLQLVAHVSAYRVILKRWEVGETERQTAIPYPDALLAWTANAFDMLKQRQAALLGIAADGTQGSPLMRLIAAKL